MEYLGVLAFVIVLCYMSYPDKVKKLERKVKKLEKERCRESIMSKLIEELVGRDCKISSEKGINFVGKTEFECHVMDCDEVILSILVYTFFSRMFDLMLPPVAKHSIVVA